MSEQFDPRLCGWIDDPVIREEAFAMLPDRCKRPFRIVGAPNDKKRMMLFEVVRKVVAAQKLQADQNGDIPNIRQEIGDCVSWGAKHAIEYLQCCQIALGNLAELKLVFSPYLYGCGRVFIGGGQMGRQDGSVGIWQAQAVMKYGAIPIDTTNCPPYSGRVASQWGSSENALTPFVPIGEQHLIKTTTKISSWDDLVQAIVNLYPVTVASDIGYSMEADSTGFMRRGSAWGHQMCFIGIDDGGDGIEPHAIILNSWSDVHGHLTDLRNPNLKLPVGVLRVRKRDAQIMLDADDSWAYSTMIDFESQILPEENFDMI